MIATFTEYAISLILLSVFGFIALIMAGGDPDPPVDLPSSSMDT